MHNLNPFGVTHIMCRKVCGHCEGTRNEGASLLTPCIVCKGSGDEPVGVPLEDFIKMTEELIGMNENQRRKALSNEIVEEIVAKRKRAGGKDTVG